MNKVIATLLISIAIFSYIFLKGEKEGKEQVTIKDQQQQIGVQNEIIKQSSQVIQRRHIFIAVSPNANLDWMRQHRCPDCISTRLLPTALQRKP